MLASRTKAARSAPLNSGRNVLLVPSPTGIVPHSRFYRSSRVLEPQLNSGSATEVSKSVSQSHTCRDMSRMHANEMHELHNRHHKVSPNLNSYKTHIILSNMKS